jgi:hypothetical protein
MAKIAKKSTKGPNKTTSKSKGFYKSKKNKSNKNLIIFVAIFTIVCSFLVWRSFAASVTTTLSPIADSYVDSSSPSSTFGATDTSIYSDNGNTTVGDKTIIGYIKFDLSSLAGKTITGATLKVYANNTSTSTQNIKSVSDNSWPEAISWSTKPIAGSQVASISANTGTGVWVSVDLTSYLAPKAGQQASLEVDQSSIDGFAFNSKNNSANKPQLVVTYDDTIVPPPPPPPPTGSTTIAAVGDFCGSNCPAVAKLIGSWSPYRLLGLGDYQYQNAGSSGTTFKSGYQNTFSALHSLTIPTFGSTHDTCDGSGVWECYPVSFFNSYGAVETKGKLYDHQPGYSFNLPNGWHVVNFNYDSSSTVRTQALSFVHNDLAGRSGQCVIAMDHAPLGGSPSSEHPTNEASAFASSLYAGGVDLMLNGHQHFYERVYLNNGSTKQFTVGTGGIGPYTRSSTGSGSEKYISGTYGALKVTLSSGTWTAQFISTGGSVLDSASGTCAD